MNSMTQLDLFSTPKPPPPVPEPVTYFWGAVWKECKSCKDDDERTRQFCYRCAGRGGYRVARLRHISEIEPSAPLPTQESGRADEGAQ